MRYNLEKRINWAMDLKQKDRQQKKQRPAKKAGPLNHSLDDLPHVLDFLSFMCKDTPPRKRGECIQTQWELITQGIMLKPYTKSLILALLSDGVSPDEICAFLSISPRSFKVHISQIKKTLHAQWHEMIFGNS